MRSTVLFPRSVSPHYCLRPWICTLAIRRGQCGSFYPGVSRVQRTASRQEPRTESKGSSPMGSKHDQEPAHALPSRLGNCLRHALNKRPRTRRSRCLLRQSLRRVSHAVAPSRHIVRAAGIALGHGSATLPITCATACGGTGARATTLVPRQEGGGCVSQPRRCR